MISERRLAEAHRKLLEEIATEVRETEPWTGRLHLSGCVMAAMARVPRHFFVPAHEISVAYANRPLGIGYGQTISQPYIVALMTDLLDLTEKDQVLEIGTGCGYQTAVLAEIARRVCSIEVVPELAEQARERLQRLGYTNVEVRTGDGYQGWPEEAPFDGIIVTAAPTQIPETLVKQLAPGGRMVIPVGELHETQMLYRCVKQADGTLTTESKLPVAFVPMVEKDRR